MPELSRRTIKRVDQFFLYVVECADGTYYTGYTANLEKRLKLHNSGRGAKSIKGKLPVKLVYQKEYRYYKNAIKAERDFKKLSRKKKEEEVRLYTQSLIKNISRFSLISKSPPRSKSSSVK